MWVFQVFLEVLQPLGANGTVHRAMVTAERHRHVVALLPALLRCGIWDDSLLCAADGQDARLWRIDDGAELGDS